MEEETDLPTWEITDRLYRYSALKEAEYEYGHAL